jgi:threonine/homoserine/homoserine lactone efflux protein
MPAHLGLFLAASLGLALFPGPSILFVSTRALAAGRAEGTASCLGTGLGGMAHVLAATLGLSALLLASSHLFTLLKFAGALYLAWLGLTTLRDAPAPPPNSGAIPPLGLRAAFRHGVLVEALNPKTALFFLAFLPQFVAPHGAIAGQLLVLGLISVALNTGADLLAATLAARFCRALTGGGRGLIWARRALGAVLLALGADLALTAPP